MILDRDGIEIVQRQRRSRLDRLHAEFLLFLLRVQDFPAGFAKCFMLLVQTGNDTAAAGRGAAAVFVVIGLTGGALFSRQSLRGGRAGKPDGEYDDGHVKLEHETS
jgi:hypothetical protein